MKEFSIPMALVDYIPVVLFCLSMLTVLKDLRNKADKPSLILIALGAVMVTCAGGLKATYKLLYAAGIGDFPWMSRQMFSNQAIGFLLAGSGILMYLRKFNRTRVNAILPTGALIGIMVIGLGAMCAGLASLASKLRKNNALFCFVGSFFLSLAMGYLSSKDFDRVIASL